MNQTENTEVSVIPEAEMSAEEIASAATDSASEIAETSVFSV